MSDPIDAEVVKDSSQALVVRQSQEVAPAGLFGTHEPVAIIERATIIATSLKSVIVRQGLVSRISGKDFPKCEAWTLLGTMLGVFPVCCWSKPVEGGWEARVEARTKDGAIVGSAEAQCLRSERNWKDRDDFALRSMAQTRATAKCLRMPLGFVMTLAGYEPTPAEEMVAESHHRPDPPPHVMHDPPPAPAPVEIPFPTEQSRAKMISALKAGVGEPNRDTVLEFFRKLSDPAALLPNEELESLPLRFCPATTGQMKDLAEAVSRFSAGDRAEWPYKPHIEPDPVKPKAKSPKSAADNTELFTGLIERVSEKTGEGKRGPWTLYGVKIGNTWLNTFDSKLGDLAKNLQGRSVNAYGRKTDRGYDLTALEEAARP